jgi:NHLM bacteriocin system ABC transporter peptidase/ATP-binding protein
MANGADTTAAPPAAPAGRARRVHTPTVLQMEAVECGAAALAMVLAYYGRWVPLEELRLAAGVSRDGSNALNVLKAARRYGLDAKGFRKEPADLRALPLPFIVFWNFNHFVVVEGFRGGSVYLNDPAMGPRRVPDAEFDHSFTGIALTFERGPEFKKSGHPPSLWRSLGDRLHGSRLALAFVVLASLLLVVPGVLIPAFTKVFVDEYLVLGLKDWVRPLLLAMALTAVLRGLLTWVQQAYLLRLEARMAVTASSRFLWHVLRMPMEFFTQRYAGDLAGRVAANDRVAQLLSGDLATNVVNVIQVVFFAAVMLFYDPVLTAIGVFLALSNVVALRMVARWRTDANRRLLQDQGKLMATTMNGLVMIETVKATGAEGEVFERLAGHQAKIVSTTQAMGVPNLVLSALPRMLAALTTAIILGVGGLRVIQGVLSMGMLVAFQSLMASFMAPIQGLVDLSGKLQEAQGDLTRLDDVLRYPADPRLAEAAPTAAAPARRVTGSLEMRDVTFGYSPIAPPLVESFNVSLRPGSRVAIVGATGSGKSTVARLLTGLYRPWSGDILVDGQPLADVPREVLRGSLASVDQDIFLFQGTVRENLTLWDATVPDDQVVQAARDAFIHQTVSARAEGYGSLVQEGGINFSGGERQRLEIARALVSNPAILVLDEATAALDPVVEKTIDDNLRRRGCTCVIIAHRLSTIRDCDEIVVLEHGKVVQRGTHDELAAVDGPYARLIAAE